MTDNYTEAALYGMKNFNSKVREKVKKEMGNVKLIELLNEYNKNNYNKSDLYYLFEIENGMLFCYDDATDVQRTMQDEAMVICSKKFGFIKWLVDNDKIDFDKIEEKSEYTFIKNGGGEHIIEDVLMLLSIQDNPIEFLISILR